MQPVKPRKARLEKLPGRLSSAKLAQLKDVHLKLSAVPLHANVPFASVNVEMHLKFESLRGGQRTVNVTGFAPVFSVREETWNPARMQLLATSKADKILKALAAPEYLGPTVESPEVVRAFLSETIRHTVRVRRLVEQLGGNANTHDLVEFASVESVEALANRLAANPEHDVAWLRELAADARARGMALVDVGKLSPQVVAGLARSDKPDALAIALHRLSVHHQVRRLGPVAGHVETAVDVLDALVSPRTYKAGMSYEAATKIFWDMVEKNQVTFPDTAEAHTVFDHVVKAHKSFSKTVWKV